MRKLRHTLHQVGNGALALFLTCCLMGCGNDIEKTKIFEPQQLPTQTIKNAHVQRSENGKLQMIMTAPLIEQYSKPEEKTEYRKGVYMRFYSGYKKPTAILRARYACDHTQRNVMEVRDSVVIIDLQRGDTVHLANLTWDKYQHHIYSDKPVRSHCGPRVTYGDSFESDDEFVSPLIVHQRGTIEWTEEE